MSKDEFQAVTTEAFAMIEQQLAGHPHGAAIMGKLRHAYTIAGSREKLRQFFAELALPIGSVEQQAMSARNSPAHGARQSVSDRDQVFLNRAYRTLFDRVLLKILGYTGEYLDRSHPDRPRTPIDQPMAGWRA
jgi:hypothetical protein